MPRTKGSKNKGSKTVFHEITRGNKKGDLALNVAKGATGVAIAAGAVAAGAALMHQQTRTKIGENLGQGLKMMQGMASTVAEEAPRVQSYAHEITSKSGRKPTQKKRGRKSKKQA